MNRCFRSIVNIGFVCLLAGLFQLTAIHPFSPGSQSFIDLGANQGCTSFCLDNNGFAVFGANYDNSKSRYDGLVFVNKRNVSKSFHKTQSSGDHVAWTSKYGSVTFNFIASQTSWAGMNEVGLIIYSMRLQKGSKAPQPDKRPWILIHYWLQYMLDNFSTVEEILATDSTMRVASSGRIPHYLVSDRYGNCATVEFIDGKMVTHSGKSLPVKVLANTDYECSLREWNDFVKQKKDGSPVLPMNGSSRGRFIGAAKAGIAFKPTDSKTAVMSAFDILKRISYQTNWSIVFDAKNLLVYFKTIVNPEIRMIDFHKLDFSCNTPVKLIDINENLSEDITDRLIDYSFEYHFEHALNAARKYGLEITPDELKAEIQWIERFQCKN